MRGGHNDVTDFYLLQDTSRNHYPLLQKLTAIYTKHLNHIDTFNSHGFKKNNTEGY